jgi:hypothetical protein
MMSSRKKRRRHSYYTRHDGEKTLKQRLRENFPDSEVLVGATSDGVKMSEVLEAFIEPYRASATTEDRFHKLVMLAGAAWNMALFPVKGRLALIQSLLKTLPRDARADARTIIGEMIVRKKAVLS